MLALQVLLALAVLSGAPVLLWRRRDNVFAYVAAGSFVATYLIPVVPTLAANRFDHHTIALYADILTVGAVAFAAALWLGGQVGARSPHRLPLTFSGGLSRERLWIVASRTRALACVGLLALVLAFLVMRYVPYFAADRTAAKYGVGPYRTSFARASTIYRLALALCAPVLPVLLALWYRGRRLVDLGLALLVTAGLFLSLSREAAFIGPLVFAIAVAVERGHRAAVIAVAVTAVCSVGALVSLALVNDGTTPDRVADRIAASTPDVRDHLGFLRGFEKHPEPTYGRTLLAGLSLSKGRWDPSTYALRTLTGFTDFSDFASGGLRLPAPLWGFSAFGWAGAAMFTGLSGFFAGWGLVKVRRLLGPVGTEAGTALALVLAYAFYEGTFGVLSEFYFLTSSVIVRASVAAALCVAVRVTLVRMPRRTVPAWAGAGAA